MLFIEDNHNSTELWNNKRIHKVRNDTSKQLATAVSWKWETECEDVFSSVLRDEWSTMEGM